MEDKFDAADEGQSKLWGEITKAIDAAEAEGKDVTKLKELRDEIMYDPAEGSSTTVEGSTPVEGSSTTVEGSSKPVEGSSKPVEGSSTPVEGSSGGGRRKSKRRKTKRRKTRRRKTRR